MHELKQAVISQPPNYYMHYVSTSSKVLRILNQYSAYEGIQSSFRVDAKAEEFIHIRSQWVSTGPNSTSTRSLPSVVYRINPNSITFDPSKQMYAFVVYREDQPYVVHIEKGLHGYNQVKISRPLEDETQFERERFFDR